MYRIVAIKVHPANDQEMEFISETVNNLDVAQEFYGIILDCQVFYDVRLEYRVGQTWFSMEV